MGSAKLEFDNEFWRFSLRVYATPGVADECLALQETFEIDVNLLLFCAWLGGSRRVVLTQSDINRADVAVRDWRECVVRPLRGIRQTLKSICGDCAGFRPKVKVIELEAEQMEQAMLYAHACEHSPKASQTNKGEEAQANVRTFMLYATRGRASLSNGMIPRKLIEAAIGLNR
jgi:uncharacterized protein (TIGR02444 family)